MPVLNSVGSEIEETVRTYGFWKNPAHYRMVDLAIFSLHHSPIGKMTQARPFTASAHIRYISRPSAKPHLFGERMPEEPKKAMTWLAAEEAADRKNARVVDKMMLALPKELDAEQREQVVRRFANRVTEGRASWIAAIHEQGKDTQNPHCHLVVRDRDAETGKRVFQTSEKNSTQRLRLIWEECANEALAEAGSDEKIDRRTLKEQGIDLAPTIHEGPQAREMDRRGASPQSRPRDRRNGIGAKKATRVVHYPNLDKGRSRPAYNRNVRQVGIEAERVYWRELDDVRLHEELEELRTVHIPAVDNAESLMAKRRAWVKGKKNSNVWSLAAEQERQRENEP